MPCYGTLRYAARINVDSCLARGAGDIPGFRSSVAGADDGTKRRCSDTVKSLIAPVQWEGFREGVDDVRYVTTLEKAIAETADAEVAREARQWLEDLKRENAQQQRSWKAQRSLPANLNEIRSRAAAWINQLTE